MKRLFFVLATVSLLLACGGSKSKQEVTPVDETIVTVQENVEEVIDGAADYTAEQWEELKNEYNALVTKAEKEADKFTEEEKARLEELKQIIESAKEDVSDAVNEAVDAFKKVVE